MSSLYYLNVTIHVLAAILWLGGMFFLGVVGAPVLRAIESPAVRAQVFSRLGRQFRLVGWIAISVLLVTGVLNLYFHGLLRTDVLGSPEFWGGRYGHALAWKLGAVAVMVTISALHDFVFGPASARLEPGSPESARMRRRASWLARANAITGIILVIAAVRLARGG